MAFIPSNKMRNDDASDADRKKKKRINRNTPNDKPAESELKTAEEKKNRKYYRRVLKNRQSRN